MKRSSETPGTSWPSKRRRSTDVQAYVDAVQRLQEQLNALDSACAKEQLRIQREFDAKKEPLLKARTETVACIPNFWRATLLNHPDVFRSEQDAEILSYLEAVWVEDNEDDFGSHTIRLTFAEGNPFFSELEVVKKIKVLEDNAEQVTNSPISWAAGKKPKQPSFFDYFKTEVSVDGDLGDVIRRDLWINPYVYFLALAPDGLIQGELEDPQDPQDDEIHELYQEL